MVGDLRFDGANIDGDLAVYYDPVIKDVEKWLEDLVVDTLAGGVDEAVDWVVALF